MRKFISKTLIFFSMALGSCSNEGTQNKTNDSRIAMEEGSFGYDLNFLLQYDSVIVLKGRAEEAQVVVSPKYQGKVFTSTAAGLDGNSFGWINYKAFSGPVDEHMNAYGGENRFWLGPEGGIYSLFFEKGKEMVFENWKTPAAIDTEPWKVVEQQDNSIRMQKDIKLVNYAGTELKLVIDREIRILTKENIAELLAVNLPDSVRSVGYLTANSITNKNTFDWNGKTGMPCIWMLDMFKPSPRTTIVIPYKNEVADAGSQVATTDYFGEIPSDRIRFKDGVLLFRADGKHRGKLGIGPNRALPLAGSWDAVNGVLTITLFDVHSSGKYLNQEWNTDKPPFSGDAVNAYNDGPLEDGLQMGPFYEIESVSPACFLKPNAKLTHNHSVFHFTGEKQSLDAIARKVLGASLTDIESTFK